MVTKLADQVGIVDWIPEGYHNNFKTTMISDLATRYTIIQKELESKQGLSVEKQRMILSIIFDQYGSLKSFILQHLEIRWKRTNYNYYINSY